MKQSVNRGSLPSHLRSMRSTSHLKMAHKRHTGHVLPKRNTSYAVLAMIVLCIGALLSSWTHAVTADSASYTVHASVPGPPPSIGATIDTPLTGAAFTGTPITVTGTCPVGTYVEILRNNFSSGVALCASDGTYSLQIDLFAGVNQLIAQDYSFTDQPGPASGVSTISFTPPGQPSGGGTGSSSTPYNPTTPGNTLPEPLVMKAHYTFVGYYVGQPAQWVVHVEGGSAPYAVSVVWGDGTTQLYSLRGAQDVYLQHTYSRTGGYHGSFPVKITASDVDGHQTYLQLLAIISNHPKTVASTVGSGGIGQWLNNFSFTNVVGYIWSGYGLLILMLISFWLGERREYYAVQRKNRRGRHA